MDILHAIRSYADQPLTHQLLVSILKEYKRPNDKINSLVEEGVLTPVKKGLYVSGPELGLRRRPEPYLLANHLSGPSYVSIDSALSYYGLIPERVYEISSVTVKASREFLTPIGRFSYTHLPMPYYIFGIRQVQVSRNQTALMASPEKALFDKIVTTKNLKIRSKNDAMHYLLDDLRMNEYGLKEMNLKMMDEWIKDSPKEESLAHIIKTIHNL
jgi:hypothetical protein